MSLMDRNSFERGERIAVIGTGISGNLIARLLDSRQELHVFEANHYVGGHTNTLDVVAFGKEHSVDTGFMVFNERTYPNFCRMLRMLDVAAQDSDMSFVFGANAAALSIRAVR